MMKPPPLTIAAITAIAALFSGCGGSSHGAYSPVDEIAPTAVTNLAGNAGDDAVSLGWELPETGSPPFSYSIAITPTAANATITRIGTRAVIHGLNNDTTYTFAISAKNNIGESPAATILLKPTAIDASVFSALNRDIADVNGPSGIFDPSLLNTSSALWMAYSSVDHYQQAGSLVQDVSASLAYSHDSGATFTYLTTIGTAANALVTPTTLNPCGNVSCNGRWVYAAPFLVEDDNDPDSARRFKLFALKYFFYPSASPTSPAFFYALGAIVMWTAPSPESTWTDEGAVLSWDSTPHELAPINNINTLDPALTECAVLTEGGATSYQGALDFVFACPNTSATQKIVMLRSRDHAKTFEYVSTPLAVADAAAFGALYFSAPSLLPSESSAPVLIATPIANRAVNNSTGGPTNQEAYSGCIVFPIADEATGSLFRNNGTPLSILKMPHTANHLNGACAWDRGIGASGILMNDADASASVPFGILNTAKRL